MVIYTINGLNNLPLKKKVRLTEKCFALPYLATHTHTSRPPFYWRNIDFRKAVPEGFGGGEAGGE